MGTFVRGGGGEETHLRYASLLSEQSSPTSELRGWTPSHAGHEASKAIPYGLRRFVSLLPAWWYGRGRRNKQQPSRRQQKLSYHTQAEPGPEANPRPQDRHGVEPATLNARTANLSTSLVQHPGTGVPAVLGVSAWGPSSARQGHQPLHYTCIWRE